MEVKDDEIYFAKLRSDAIIPTKKKEDAGYDLYACFDGDYFVIGALETRPVPTGIAVAFSSKYYAQIEERSSTGKKGIKKSAGVMDSGYRGEYLVLTFNTNQKPLVITKIEEDQIPDHFEAEGKAYNKSDCIFYPYKKAICEVVLQIVPDLCSKEISYEELKNIKSERGAGGFGSSGK